MGIMIFNNRGLFLNAIKNEDKEMFSEAPSWALNPSLSPTRWVTLQRSLIHSRLELLGCTVGIITGAAAQGVRSLLLMNVHRVIAALGWQGRALALGAAVPLCGATGSARTGLVSVFSLSCA